MASNSGKKPAIVKPMPLKKHQMVKITTDKNGVKRKRNQDGKFA